MTPPPPRSTLFPYTTLFRSLKEPLHLSKFETGARILDADPSLSGPVPYFAPSADSQHASRNTERDRRSEEHTSELQSRRDLVCRLLLEKKKKKNKKQNSKIN